MLSRKFEIPEIYLDNQDKEDLINALIPLKDYLPQIVEYLPFLPLGLFSFVYGYRIYKGNQNKKVKKTRKSKNNKGLEE
jgi:hypothetical protein